MDRQLPFFGNRRKKTQQGPESHSISVVCHDVVTCFFTSAPALVGSTVPRRVEMVSRLVRLTQKYSLIISLFAHSLVTSGFDGENIYVSRTQGNDSLSCGTVTEPCKTIPHAIGLAHPESVIYLDGTGSDHDPYDCSPEQRGHSWILINKTLSFVGFRSIPHISCFPGFFFICPGQSNVTVQSQHLSFTSLSFHNTSVQFHDCSAEITNCSFLNAQNPLHLQVSNRGIKVSLAVTLSWFQNNSGCISALFGGSIERIQASLEVRWTTFHNNSATTSERGLVSVTSNKEDIFQNSVILLNIDITQVNFTENCGPLISTDYSAAIIKETCKQVRFVNNKALQDQEIADLWKSLHVTRAKAMVMTFVGIHSEGNTDSRCIGIHADVVKVNVNRSRFIGHSITGRGGSVLVKGGSDVDITLADVEFTRSGADRGGVLYLEETHKKGSLHVYSTRLLRCESSNGAIVIGEYNKSAVSFDVIFHNVTVQRCVADALMATFAGPSFVKMIDTHWFNNTARAIVIDGMRAGNITMVIQASTMKRNQVTSGSDLVSLLHNDRHSYIYGTLTVFDTILSGNSAGFYVVSSLTVNFTNVTFESTRLPIMMSFGGWWLHERRYVTVFIENCSFRDSLRGLTLSLQYASSLNVSIEHSIFLGTEVLWFTSQHLISSIFLLNNVTAESSDVPVFLDFGSCSARDDIIFEMKNCRFRRSVSPSVITMPSDELRSPGCTNRTNRNKHQEWRYKSHVIIRDTWFEENSGQDAALHISNGNFTFMNCTFKNNFGDGQAGHIYVTDGSARVEMINCNFIQTKLQPDKFYKKGNPSFAFVYTDSAGPLVSRNTVYSTQVFHQNALVTVAKGGYVQADNSSMLQCSTGSLLTIQDFSHIVDTVNNGNSCQLSITVLAFSCKPCGPGLYSLQRGNSTGLTVGKNIQCYPCPYGANCTGAQNILARQNFWGYKSPTDSSKLTFAVCPSNYCLPPDTDNPSVYNGCYGNRSGVLCGQCKPHFTEALFSTECRHKSDCDDHWFWALFIVFVLALALYFVLKPPLVHSVMKHVVWFTSKHEPPAEGEHSQHADKGYLKIVFYFYQSAEVLMLESFLGLLYEVHVLSAFVAAFNFQARLPVEGGSSICPFPGMTAVSKELFLASGVIGTFVAILLLFLAHCALNLVRKLQRPSTARYVGAILQTLLLGYASLAKTTLKLLTCVPLNKMRLFYDGNIQCYQWWQNLLIVFLVIFVLPFIAVLFWESIQLHKGRCTPGEFLFACFLPLPFIVHRIIKCLMRKLSETPRVTPSCTEHHADNRAALCRILHEPFRLPTERTRGTLYWEGVLTGRRFIILCMHSMIADPLLRLFLVTLACLVFLVHHMAVKPFKNSTANLCEAISLFTLVLIATINLIKASFVSTGTVLLDPTKQHIRFMEWLEVILLGVLPVMFVFTITFGILSLAIRCIIKLVKKCSSVGRATSTREGMSPEQNSPVTNPGESTPLIHNVRND